MSEKLLLFPFGGNARESLLCVLDINRSRQVWDVLGFIDDNPSMMGGECCGTKVIGGREVLAAMPDAVVLAVPGSPRNYLRRRDIIEGLNLEASRFATIIHPSVVVSPDSSIGHNTVIMPNVVISCGVRVGNHCVVLPNTVISHDSSVGDYCCIGSNVSISGNVSIGQGCYIGSGTKIRENVRIGEKSLLGLGANVISDIESGVVAVGNPARVVRRISF